MVFFKDRADAGEQLAERLLEYQHDKSVIVLGLPRGGVVIAYYIAKKLDVVLDIVIARKLGAPSSPELAMGAVSEDGTVFLDASLVALCKPSQSYIDRITEQEYHEALRRVKKYRDNRPLPDLHGKIAILVDDGIATGATMEVALKTVLKHKPKQVIIAVPVLPHDKLDRFRKQVDDIVYLSAPEDFMAIGSFYQDFTQVTDDEVITLLHEKSI